MISSSKYALIFSVFVGLLFFSSSAISQNKSGFRNILSLSPLNSFSLYGYSPDYGYGISYERIFGGNGKFGMKIPISIGYSNKSDFDGNHFKDVVKLNPSIFFYPWGQRRLSAGLGFSLCYMDGIYYSLSNPTKPNERFTHLGLMANQTLRFAATNHFCIGISLGLGPSFSLYTEEYRRNYGKTVTGKMQYQSLSLSFKS